MSDSKKGKKGKHGNKEVPGEWAVRTLTSPSRRTGSAENDSFLEKQLTSDSEDKPQLQNEIYHGEKFTSLLLTDFIDSGLEQAGGLALKKTSRNNAANGVRSPCNSSLTSNDAQSLGCNTVQQDLLESNISGQSSYFSREGKKCTVPESLLATSSGSVPENDQAKIMSDIEVSVEDSSAIDDNCNYKEDECKQRDIYSVVKQLKKLSLVEPELSESQIEINYQEQEDELLALKAIYGDDVMVFDREDDSLCALKISIHIEIPENILITVSLAPFSNRHEPSGNNNRSSLREDPIVENKYTFSVQHLPPIVLVCVLPKSYPYDMPPQYAILSYWLDSVSIAKLCKCLDNIWFEDSGQVVLYKWAEWLHKRSLSELGFNHDVLLDPYGMKTNVDWRAISGCSTPDVDIPRLMQYNDAKNNEVFQNTLHVCNICFNQYPGTEFVKLLCQHIFCWKCMEMYSHVHVKDGTVNKLNCPDPKCGVSISPALLKRLLGDEAFERWESLLLQKTLDSMVDVVYCPRCEAASLEDEDNHAQCAKCFYSFCSLCRDRRHVGQICMSPEMRLRILQFFNLSTCASRDCMGFTVNLKGLEKGKTENNYEITAEEQAVNVVENAQRKRPRMAPNPEEFPGCTMLASSAIHGSESEVHYPESGISSVDDPNLVPEPVENPEAKNVSGGAHITESFTGKSVMPSLVKLARNGIIFFSLPGNCSPNIVRVLAEIFQAKHCGEIKAPVWCHRILPVQATCLLKKEDLHDIVVKLVKEHIGDTESKIERPLKIISKDRRGFSFVVAANYITKLTLYREVSYLASGTKICFVFNCSIRKVYSEDMKTKI